MTGLLLACADPEEKQFTGLRLLMSRLAAELPGLAHREWRGEIIDRMKTIADLER